MNPTKNPVSKKQQHHDHIQKKRSNAVPFGIHMSCNFPIFYKRCSQGRINERGLYSANIEGFIISKISLRRREKINKGHIVCRNKLSVIGVEKFIRKIKLIRIIDLLIKGKVRRLNKTNRMRSINRKIKLIKQFRARLKHN